MSHQIGDKPLGPDLLPSGRIGAPPDASSPHAHLGRSGKDRAGAGSDPLPAWQPDDSLRWWADSLLNASHTEPEPEDTAVSIGTDVVDVTSPES
ncbi:MAG: hypothetical protein ACLQVD_09995 [Capsulimonadaceae bacterium]